MHFGQGEQVSQLRVLFAFHFGCFFYAIFRFQSGPWPSEFPAICTSYLYGLFPLCFLLSWPGHWVAKSTARPGGGAGHRRAAGCPGLDEPVLLCSLGTSGVCCPSTTQNTSLGGSQFLPDTFGDRVSSLFQPGFFSTVILLLLF